jgi:hypothetical protein
MAKRKKMTAEERAARREDRAARFRARMRGIEHRLFGQIVSEPVPGTVFDPLAYFTCPGRFRDVKAFLRARAARAGVGSGLPRETRAAVLDEAVQNGLDFIIGRDYAAAGFDADQCAAAILSAAGWLDRALWRALGETQAGAKPRKGAGDFLLFNRAQTARAAGDNPAACVAAAEAMGMVWSEVFPAAHEIPGLAVALPGGPSGRGETDGKMVRDGGRIRWRMRRGRGRAHTYAPGIVRDAIPTAAPRYVPGPRPAGRGGPAVWRQLPGEPVAYAPDVEAYRAAVRAAREEEEVNWTESAADHAAAVERAREFAARRD